MGVARRNLRAERVRRRLCARAIGPEDDRSRSEAEAGVRSETDQRSSFCGEPLCPAQLVLPALAVVGLAVRAVSSWKAFVHKRAAVGVAPGCDDPPAPLRVPSDRQFARPAVSDQNSNGTGLYFRNTCRASSGRVVGNPYLGITSRLRVIRWESLTYSRLTW